MSEDKGETRPHISRVLVVTVLWKVLEADACQVVPWVQVLERILGLRAQGSTQQGETRGKSMQLGLKNAFRDRLQVPGRRPLVFFLLG